MIEASSVKSIMKSMLSYAFFICKFFLRRNQFGRFILATPSFLSKQILFDRRRRTFIRFKIRDGIDLQTLKMIWVWGDYDLQRLRRWTDLSETYRRICDSESTPLIVDLGGHAGLSASFFSYTFPEARIIVLEPNEENFELAKQNTINFPRITILNKAIGSCCGRGELFDPQLGSDAFRLDYLNQTGSVEIIDMQTLLCLFPEEKIEPFIVKCDIEGSEHNLFSANVEWVDKFPLLIIELHDWLFPGKGYSKHFLSLASSLEGDFVHSGENIFFIK